jgi:hypothetical protein
MATRLGEASRRAGTAKRALAVGSAAVFAAALLLARVSHPGHSGAAAGSAGTASSAATDDSGFGFGSASIAPSDGGAASVQSSGS